MAVCRFVFWPSNPRDSTTHTTGLADEDEGEGERKTGATRTNGGGGGGGGGGSGGNGVSNLVQRFEIGASTARVTVADQRQLQHVHLRDRAGSRNAMYDSTGAGKSTYASTSAGKATYDSTGTGNSTYDSTGTLPPSSSASVGHRATNNQRCAAFLLQYFGFPHILGFLLEVPRCVLPYRQLVIMLRLMKLCGNKEILQKSCKCSKVHSKKKKITKY